MATIKRPSKVTFDIWKGTTFQATVIYLDKKTGQPINVTGCTGLLEIKTSSEGSVLLSLSDTNSRIVFGGQDGSINLSISDTDTALITWKHGVYDLTITFPNGETDVLLWGAVRVRGI